MIGFESIVCLEGKLFIAEMVSHFKRKKHV
jgi:hypothetical protein